MSLFVDSSAFYAAVDRGDRDYKRAVEVLRTPDRLVTTDHVLVETWLLLRTRLGLDVADDFWERLRGSGTIVEPVTAADLEVAWAIGGAFPDQGFSIVDRTSFAVMQRLGLTRVATFDDDFAIFRYGRSSDRAFEISR